MNDKEIIELKMTALRLCQDAYDAGYHQGKLDSVYDPLTAAKVRGEMQEKANEAYRDGNEHGKRDAVVHGCWIDKSESGKRQDWPPECSACHKRSNAGYSDFCHNCGAQMDADHLREDTKMMDGTKGESK